MYHTESAIIQGDAIACLSELRQNSVQLIVTSPPYNIGKAYEKENRLTNLEYEDFIYNVICLCKEKLKNGGSVCWQVGNQVNKNRVVPLDYVAYNLFTKCGFSLRNRIIWRFNFGLHARTRLSGRYETILWFTKGDDYVFNLDPIRIPQLYPGKRHSKRKGDKAGTLSGNPLGKNPSDFWEFDAKSFFADESVWNIPNVKANHPERTTHPCQYPVELAERCVLAFSNEQDIVVDPFVGTGSTVIAAEKHRRIGLGFDRDLNYVRLAEERLQQFRAGELPLRQPGKAVAQPSSSQKVARFPLEWMNGEGEPHRVCRRPQLVRSRVYDKQDDEQIFP